MTARNLAPAVLVLLAFAAVFGTLEQVVNRLGTPEHEDPRLGIAAFWVWALSVTALTYVTGPYLTRPNPSLEWLIWGPAAIGWLAWKLGLNKEWETSARDREEIWATTVGTILGLVVFDMRR